MTIDEPTHKGSPLGDEHVGPASGCYWCWYGGEAWMAGNDKGKEEMTLAIIEESKDAPHLEHPMTGILTMSRRFLVRSTAKSRLRNS